MPRLPAIETKRLYRHIADVVAQHIDSGAFAPGSTLPAERELATQMRVSRTSIREALIALEVEGRVSVRVGVGVVVLPPGTRPAPAKPSRSRAATAADWSQVGPLQLLEARRVVECESAALAARHASAADLAEIDQLCVAMARTIKAGTDHYPLDERFHVRIAQACGNAAIALLVAELWAHRASTVSRKFEEHFVDAPLYRATLTDHQAILATLVARDARGARAAMKRHLDRVHDAYSRDLA